MGAVYQTAAKQAVCIEKPASREVINLLTGGGCWEYYAGKHGRFRTSWSCPQYAHRKPIFVANRWGAVEELARNRNEKKRLNP